MSAEAKPQEVTAATGHAGMLSADRTYPLESRAGGSCRDWIRHLHQDAADEPLASAGEPMRRIFMIYKLEDRTERLVDRLVAIEREAQTHLSMERIRGQALEKDCAFMKRMLDERDRECAALRAEFAGMNRNWAWRAIRMIRCDIGRLRRIFRHPAPAPLRAGQPNA